MATVVVAVERFVHTITVANCIVNGVSSGVVSGAFAINPGPIVIWAVLLSVLNVSKAPLNQAASQQGRELPPIFMVSFSDLRTAELGFYNSLLREPRRVREQHRRG